MASLELFARDVLSTESTVVIEFSKDALVGFAINAIRIAENNEKHFKHHWQIDPLNNPTGSKPFGFYLTTESPTFVLDYNPINEQIIDLEIEGDAIELNSQFKFEYVVDLDYEELFFEQFDLGFNNLARINIFDGNGNNVTQLCQSLVLKITYNGLIALGENLLRVAHRFKVGNEYILRSIKNPSAHNFGIVLSEKSPKLIIRCSELGCVFDYEPSYGKI